MGNKQVVTTKLSDLCELIVDCPHSTPKWTDSGFIVLRNQNIRNGSLDLSSPSFTDESGYNSRIKRAVPQAGDIVLTREAPMGEVCLIPEGLQCCLGQRQVLLRPMKGVSEEYLFWALQSPFVRHQISWSEGTGTTVSNIRIPVLKAFEIPRWFENEPQIASYLSAIKNKITLNRQINQTLEQMAQALFKSWFVDFDPVVDNALDAGFFDLDLAFPDELLRRAEARRAVREHSDFKPLPDAIRQLFPAAFEECAEPSLGLGGWVPKGWTGQPIKSHCVKVQNGGTPSRSNSEYWDNGNIPWLTSGEVRQSIITSVDNTITVIGLQNSSAKWVDSRSTLVALYGATAGEVSITAEPLTTNQAVCALMPKESYCWLNYLQVRNKTKEMQSNAVGSAQQNISKGLVENLMVISPPLSIVETFHQKTESLFVKAIANKKMLIELAHLRDTLLPKLISGELRLDNIEADLAKEGVA